MKTVGDVGLTLQCWEKAQTVTEGKTVLSRKQLPERERRSPRSGPGSGEPSRRLGWPAGSLSHACPCSQDPAPRKGGGRGCENRRVRRENVWGFM